MHTLVATCLSLFASLGAPVVLTEGSIAPHFEVTDIAGTSLNLNTLVQKGPVVLVFFPKANTSGCTAELRNFTDKADAIAASHATLIAVSGDTAATLSEFQKTLGAHFSFVADDKGFLMKSYNTKMPILNVSRRRTLLIGQDKLIKMVLKDDDAIAMTGLLGALHGLKP